LVFTNFNPKVWVLKHVVVTKCDMYPFKWNHDIISISFHINYSSNWEGGRKVL